MKKLFLIAMTLIFGVSVMAQQRIQLRSVDKAECERSDMRGLKASFSFSTIEAENLDTQRGQFSWLSMPNTVLGGNEGDPQIPVVNELIAVPFGANPRIEITSYSTTDYRLEDYGIHTLVPRQPSLRKDQRPEDVPFVYNANAYQIRGLRSTPTASVYVDGTMRGIQVGKMTIEPVSYDPVSNILRVFNDIEVKVSFDGADMQATEDELLRTYTPYFDIVYSQMFNGNMLRDIYSQHPDLYTTPVKMIVITTSTYANNTTFQNWVNWKKQKGIYTTVYTTATTGTTASSIKSFIRNKYSTDAPTFVVVVGDTGDVTYSLSSNTTSKVTDLYYSSTSDSDLYPEMFYSRMPVSSTTELTNLLNKIMTYEQYTMPDPSYLSKVLLIAGADGTWNPRVGQPTINYGLNNYFNSAHGYTNIYSYLTSYSGCYNNLSTGVGFANYTAHGDNTMWYNPQFTVNNVSSLTNNNKYFWAMGNCCLAANWGYNGTCFAEALLRAANKGAFGYIGSCPETYWYEDYYFAVGATTTLNSTPSYNATKKGCYDAMFDDTGFNTLNSIPFIGNLAVAYAHAGSYSYSTSDKYYWEAYHCLGDGSVMPYHVNPSANNVSHANTLPLGATSFTVSAVAGSYVAITVNNEIIGVAQVPSSGTVNVPITAQTTPGTAMIVVTRQQRQPYITNISIVGTNLYTITATADPVEGGTVSGADQYYENTTCTLTATANEGYTFVNWTKNGSQVSTDPTYSFTVIGNGSYVANFSLNSYAIAVTAVPSAGGSVSGVGTYNHFETCTLTAEANEGYTFVNWTKNGTQVSTESTYAFMVTEAASYVANFVMNSYTVTATPNTVDGGSVTMTGNRDREGLFYDFEDGSLQGWTTLQGANGDSPNSWMHNANYDEEYSTGYGHDASNGFVLSESYVTSGAGSVHPDNYLVSPQIRLGGSISFWASNMEGYAEHFGVSVSMSGNTDASDFTTVQEWTIGAKAVRTGGTRSLDNGTWYEYTVDLSAYSGMGYVAIHHFDSYDQWLLCVDDITLVPYTGVASATFNHGETCTVTATANEGYAFVGWMEDEEIVSTEATYSFNVTADRNLVANFEEEVVVVEKTVTLVQGVNWWSTNLDITLDDLKAALVAAMGTNGTVTVKSQAGYIKYENGMWMPASMPFDIRQMYMIQVSNTCEMTVTGVPVNPTEHEITIHNGVNWIGFLSSESMTVTAAFAGLNPVDGDAVKGKMGSATYNGTIWMGSLQNLEPGQGYIYQSKASGNKTFTFGTNNNK